MKTFLIVGALALFASVTEAQAATRDTPCNPATPTNAICVVWQAPAIYTDSTPITRPLTYRVEQRNGTGGTFATIGTNVTALKFYVQNLSPGTYYFRVFANCTSDATVTCTEGPASNTANRDATTPVTQPGAPIVTVAVVIGHGTTPVFRVLGSAKAGYYPGAYFGEVPIGRECGAKTYTYRSKPFYRVTVQPNELWGTSNAADLAAYCASQG